MRFSSRRLLTLTLILFVTPFVARAESKRLLLIAGTASHAPGSHEHNAGVQLWAKCLADVRELEVAVSLNGWPRQSDALAQADAVVIFADGGGKHLALQADRLAQLDAFAARGGGIGFVHYAVEPTKDKGQAEFLRWVGGCFETHWSVNPFWKAEFNSLPDHPVTRGVRPFAIEDEWYFHLRFVERMKGVTPLLVAVPPHSTMSRPNGPHSGNPAVREAVKRREPQTVAWVFERANGGRGFGFTGAHSHANWGDDNFRKLVLNALLWLAQVEVPPDGVESVLAAADLTANLDPKPPKN